MSNNSAVSDVIVVGAGIIGLMTAWELQKVGKSVTILDKGKAGREASWAGGGILSQLTPWHYSKALQQLVRESQSIYPTFCEELQEISGIDPEWSQSGLLCLADQAEIEMGRAWAMQNDADHEVITTSELPERFPQLKVNQAALLLREVAQVRNPRLLNALLKSLESRGVKVIQGEPVRKLLIENSRAIGVQTLNRAFIANDVVLACGAWTPELIPKTIKRPDIRPVKGQMLLYKATLGLLETMVLKDDRYLIPRRDGRILAGSSMEEDGFNKSPTIDIKNEIRAFAETLLPELSDCEIESHWTGLRPAKSDNEPVIGRHEEIDHLWINAGHFRYGLTMAPASAIRLSEMMISQS